MLAREVRPNCHPTLFQIVFWNGTRLEKVREIVGISCVSEEGAYAEDLLHGTEIGGMREEDRTRVRNSIHVLVSVLGDDDFPNRMGEVIRIITRNAVFFGFVPPNDDCAIFLVGV